MKILIPVNRYQVDYELGSGQPFSEVDVLVLRAVASQSARSVAALHLALCLPRRMIIEVLVGLARAGWVSVTTGSDAEFLVTTAGREALQAASPPSSLVVREETDYVLMERVDGVLSGGREIACKTRKALDDAGLWSASIRLPQGRIDRRLDAGQVEWLLRRDKSEWIRWVSSPQLIQQMWLPVEIEDGRILNLPERWAHLGSRILDEIRSRGVKPAPSASATPSERESGLDVGRTLFSMDDLLVTDSAHRQELDVALSSARSTVLIASAFLDFESVDGHIASKLIECLRRGTRVDLLWGYSAGNTTDEIEKALQLLRRIGLESGHPDNFRFNDSPTNSHAKVLIYDSPNGYSAVVGSYNWLATRSEDPKFEQEPFRNASIRIDDLHTVARICRSIAGLWPGARVLYSLSDVPDRWQNIASMLERSALVSVRGGPDIGAIDSPHSVRLVRDSEHEVVIRELILGSKTRCAILSHQIGQKATVRLTSLQTKHSLDHYELIVMYGKQPDNNLLEASSALIVDAGGRLVFQRRMHSKIVICDDKVLISSYNPLSADPFGAFSSSREVGLLLGAKEIADSLWERIGMQSGRTETSHLTGVASL
ncbi:MAG TPA: phospholipase D-like domain-containing protein [Nevskiaceae bacterium]|nr:phospholipase D-like domain-containing protein [Nevskiaceae bacterium]